MVAFRGHFDGKVFVPDEPVNLPTGQRLLLRAELLETGAEHSRGVAGQDLLRFAGTIDPQSLSEMEIAIEEGCERVDANEW